MSYQDRPVSEGPARDDPELGDTLSPRTPGEPGQQAAAGEQAREMAGTARERADEVAGTARERAGEVAGTARERAGDVATGAREQARSVAETTGDEARGVAREAGGQARRLARDARDELRSQADSQATRLAERLDDLTRQLRSMGERGEPGPANDLVQQAAGQTQRVAERLRQGGVEDAIGQLRDFGRNRPGLFLLGAFGLGLVGGRMVRNLAQEPSGDGGEQSRSPVAATGRPGTAAGQGTPVPAVSESEAYAATGSGHAAYGAPVGDEQWGG